jgi:hypothetical protein
MTPLCEMDASACGRFGDRVFQKRAALRCRDAGVQLADCWKVRRRGKNVPTWSGTRGLGYGAWATPAIRRVGQAASRWRGSLTPRSPHAVPVDGSAGGTGRRLDLGAPLRRRTRIPLADHDFLRIILRSRPPLALSDLLLSAQQLAVVQGADTRFRHRPPARPPRPSCRGLPGVRGRWR